MFEIIAGGGNSLCLKMYTDYLHRFTSSWFACLNQGCWRNPEVSDV
jgi:hypothetical protein